MRAVLLRETGGPERLEPVEVPEPQPGEGQVVVRVRAAGVNFVDLLVRSGNYPQAPPLPVVPGVEIAGEVEGRRVIALLPASGGYAEAAIVDEHRLYPLPDGASFEEGAAFLLTFLTAYIPLTHLVRVGPGTTVLVHAGSGGVGSAAIQIARHLGARVVATASSEEKRRFALEQGAEEVYGYEDFAQHLRPDVVVDPVGGKLLTETLSTLAPLGALVAIGYAGGWWEELSPALLVGRNIGIHGFYLGRLTEREPETVRAAAGHLLRLWTEGAIRPVVGASFPLEQAVAAHTLIEERRHVAKVVLVP
jgi:NADPH2:quinone reductase